MAVANRSSGKQNHDSRLDVCVVTLVLVTESLHPWFMVILDKFFTQICC